jgi:uncharacterized protein (DUF488 family)
MDGRGLITVGHGTSGRAELAALLHGAGVAVLVDVRTAPGSRRNPDVTRDKLQCWFPATGIDYHWKTRLGGWRKVAADSPDIIWRNASFRRYAGYMRYPDFVAAIDAVLTDTARRDRHHVQLGAVVDCHRRLIADFAVIGRRVLVQHLMNDGRLVPHVPTLGARLQADELLVSDKNLDESSDGPTMIVNSYLAIVELRGQRATDAASFAPAGNVRRGS